MITEPENIALAFSCFHDGTIILDREVDKDFVWKVECEYLAETIRQDMGFFWMKIYESRVLQFVPWFTASESPEEVWIDPKRIFSPELEVTRAKTDGNKVCVFFNQHNGDLKGGELKISCRGVEVFDQEWTPISLKELTMISANYWDNF